MCWCAIKKLLTHSFRIRKFCLVTASACAGTSFNRISINVTVGVYFTDVAFSIMFAEFFDNALYLLMTFCAHSPWTGVQGSYAGECLYPGEAPKYAKVLVSRWMLNHGQATLKVNCVCISQLMVQFTQKWYLSSGQKCINKILPRRIILNYRKICSHWN